MSWTNCTVCQGLISAEDTACRICRTPVPGRPDPWAEPSTPAPVPPVAAPSTPGWPPPSGPAAPIAEPAPPAPWLPPAGASPSAPPPGWAVPPAAPAPGTAAPAGAPGAPGAAPAYAPPGYAHPGQAPHLYAPQAYPPPGYAPPGYAPPGYGPPPGQAPPGWSPPPGAPGGWNLPTGFQPGGWAPPAPAPKKRGGLIAVVAVVCVLVVALSGVAFLRVRPSGPDHPDQWDPRVQDAVAFVERDKGRPFDHPVYVDFMTEEQFRAFAETEPGSVTDEDRTAAEQQEAMLRAMGLVQGDIDLLAEQDTVTGGGTAALYDPTTKRVHVRGTELTPDIEGTVVHELTHAWQDQRFDLGRLQDFPTQTQATAFRMIAEGDAVMTEHNWLDTLTDDQRDSYDELSQAASDQADDELSSVPDVLVASFGAPYEFGQPFLTGLEAVEGSDYLDKAFADPPSTDEQIMDPDAYLDGEGAVEVDAPDTEGKDVIEEDSFGALFWYLALAERIDPLTALHAVDGWGGDTYAVYDRDGTTCVASRVVGDDAADTEVLGAALTEWAATLPDVTVDVGADRVDVRACDPGPDADFGYVGRSTDVIAYPVIRLLVWSQGVVEGESRERATCYGNAFIDQLALDEITEPPLSDERILELHRGAAEVCPG